MSTVLGAALGLLPFTSPLGELGFGLVGMRERVGLYHGTFSAGNRAGGGYRVRACLPVIA
jgi:signal transduction histidine kinase